MKEKEYEVTVTVEEVYIVKATSELGAFMADVEDPIKVTVKKRRIKKRPAARLEKEGGV